MFLSSLNAEIFACILLFRKSRHKPRMESCSKYGFSPDLGGKNGGVLSMRMQVILDSSFARPGSAPIRDGKKGEFRDWTTFLAEFMFPTIIFFLHWELVHTCSTERNLLLDSKQQQNNDRSLSLSRNGDLLQRGGPAIKKKPPSLNARALITREIERTNSVKAVGGDGGVEAY